MHGGEKHAIVGSVLVPFKFEKGGGFLEKLQNSFPNLYRFHGTRCRDEPS